MNYNLCGNEARTIHVLNTIAACMSNPCKHMNVFPHDFSKGDFLSNLSQMEKFATKIFDTCK